MEKDYERLELDEAQDSPKVEGASEEKEAPKPQDKQEE